MLSRMCSNFSDIDGAHKAHSLFVHDCLAYSGCVPSTTSLQNLIASFKSLHNPSIEEEGGLFNCIAECWQFSNRFPDYFECEEVQQAVAEYFDIEPARSERAANDWFAKKLHFDNIVRVRDDESDGLAIESISTLGKNISKNAHIESLRARFEDESAFQPSHSTGVSQWQHMYKRIVSLRKLAVGTVNIPASYVPSACRLLAACATNEEEMGYIRRLATMALIRHAEATGVKVNVFRTGSEEDILQWIKDFVQKYQSPSESTGEDGP
jgi:hypothetical protein